MTLEEFLREWHDASPTLTVHTSGSTGKPKPILVEKRRMRASAECTCRFLRLDSNDTALLCMPLDYIAGKMVVVRSLVSGMRLISVDPSSHPLRGLTVQPTFVAMVPLQVYQTLQVDEERERLMRVRHLIIGGGAIDAALEARLKAFPNAVWSTYGMTETLSHIALRRISGPEADCWYTPFDGIGVSLSDKGCLVIDAPAVCPARLITNDIAEMAPDGRRFRIIGRRDNVICSGGVKLQIEQIEAALRPWLADDFIITKRSNAKFGETVVLLTLADDLAEVERICAEHLPKFWKPRFVAHVDTIPLTPTGKPARAEAEHLASTL